jgi:hypothetical protein
MLCERQSLRSIAVANCEERIAEDQRKREFDLAVDALKLEVTLFWRRSVFFWGFISAAFIAYSALFRSRDTEMPFIISCFGFVCSVAWTLVNRGSKYWQEAWEQKLERVEQEVLGRPFFKEREETLKKKGVVWGARHFSVSGLAIALSDFVVVIWIGLAYKAFPGVTMFSMLALAVSLGWAISMLCLGRGRDVSN